MRPSQWRMRRSASTCGLPAKTETTRSDFPRPTALGRTLAAVEALALSPHIRSSRHGRSLAAGAVSPVLGNGLDGLLHYAHNHDEGAVRVHGAGTSSSRGAAIS